MLSNKDIRIEGGNLIINGDKHPFVSDVSDIEDDIEGLDTRVTALEKGGGFLIETVSYTNTTPIAPGAYGGVNFSVEKEGYTPLGIVGISGSGTGGLSLLEFGVRPDKTAIVFYNNEKANPITPSRISVWVLYVKN